MKHTIVLLSLLLLTGTVNAERFFGAVRGKHAYAWLFDNPEVPDVGDTVTFDWDHEGCPLWGSNCPVLVSFSGGQYANTFGDHNFSPRTQVSRSMQIGGGFMQDGRQVLSSGAVGYLSTHVQFWLKQRPADPPDMEGNFDDAYLTIHGQMLVAGDSNMDNIFDASDLVQVMVAGEYNDSPTNNSTWETGDWDYDGDFNSGDFVRAMRDGQYNIQQPVRTRHGPLVPDVNGPLVIAGFNGPILVPEPSVVSLFLAGVVVVLFYRR